MPCESATPPLPAPSPHLSLQLSRQVASSAIRYMNERIGKQAAAGGNAESLNLELAASGNFLVAFLWHPDVQPKHPTFCCKSRALPTQSIAVQQHSMHCHHLCMQKDIPMMPCMQGRKPRGAFVSGAAPEHAPARLDCWSSASQNNCPAVPAALSKHCTISIACGITIRRASTAVTEGPSLPNLL